MLQFVSNPVEVGHLASKAEITSRYQLPNSYFYLPNQFWTNKNHRLVVDALAVLKAQGIAVTVACTGKPVDGRRPEYFQELMDHVSGQGLEESFRVLGTVPFRDTQALMRHAVAVINPSRFEGWSTTVEEAKTLHKRLLLSNIPVHLEQAPATGCFFSPDSASELAQRLDECLRVDAAPVDAAVIEADYSTRLKAFGACYLRIVHAVMSGNS